jgi:uncharacterized membrane protein YvbJ
MLTRCPECGKRISDQAEACPHCGVSNSAASRQMLLQERRTRLYSVLTPVAWVALAVVAIVALFLFKRLFGS